MKTHYREHSNAIFLEDLHSNKMDVHFNLSHPVRHLVKFKRTTKVSCGGVGGGRTFKLLFSAGKLQHTAPRVSSPSRLP